MITLTTDDSSNNVDNFSFDGKNSFLKCFKKIVIVPTKEETFISYNKNTQQIDMINLPVLKNCDSGTFGKILQRISEQDNHTQQQSHLIASTYPLNIQHPSSYTQSSIFSKKQAAKRILNGLILQLEIMVRQEKYYSKYGTRQKYIVDFLKECQKRQQRLKINDRGTQKETITLEVLQNLLDEKQEYEEDGRRYREDGYQFDDYEKFCEYYESQSEEEHYRQQNQQVFTSRRNDQQSQSHPIRQNYAQNFSVQSQHTNLSIYGSQVCLNFSPIIQQSSQKQDNIKHHQKQNNLFVNAVQDPIDKVSFDYQFSSNTHNINIQQLQYQDQNQHQNSRFHQKLYFSNHFYPQKQHNSISQQQTIIVQSSSQQQPLVIRLQNSFPNKQSSILDKQQAVFFYYCIIFQKLFVYKSLSIKGLIEICQEVFAQKSTIPMKKRSSYDGANTSRAQQSGRKELKELLRQIMNLLQTHRSQQLVKVYYKVQKEYKKQKGLIKDKQKKSTNDKPQKYYSNRKNVSQERLFDQKDDQHLEKKREEQKYLTKKCDKYIVFIICLLEEMKYTKNRARTGRKNRKFDIIDVQCNQTNKNNPNNLHLKKFKGKVQQTYQLRYKPKRFQKLLK